MVMWDRNVIMNDISEKLINMFRNQLANGEIRAFLIEERDKGMRKEEMLAILEGCRAHAQNETEEDKILDMMDFVSGFCSSFARIYDFDYFDGISRTFSTEGNRQFEAIGAFWDELSAIYGRDKLRGLGYNWTENTMEYVIGLKQGIIEGANCSVRIPDMGWSLVEGRTDQLAQIYEKIYQEGSLKYEIERFNDDGKCSILYYR